MLSSRVFGWPLHSVDCDRYNSAIISTQPENEFIWAVVSPNYLKGEAFDIFATASTLAARANQTVSGLDMGVPQKMTSRPVGTPWGDILADTGARINRTAYVQHLTAWQGSILNRTSDFAILSPLDCLTRYVTFQRDASNLLVISSNDTISKAGTVMASNNSPPIVNYFGSSWDSIALRTQLWECGWSNSFSCVRPQTWQGNAASVADWNFYGYKVDYCLSKTSDLEDKCSVKFEVNIMIGMLVLFNRILTDADLT
jgi:hypothetical protein